MDRQVQVRNSIRLIRLSEVLLLSGTVPGGLAMIVWHWCRVASIATMLISLAGWLVLMGSACRLGGILLSVCPRCGKSNKDALYSFGRMLPILEIVLLGKLPLCYACERELAAKAGSRQGRRPRAEGSPSPRTARGKGMVCNVDALTRTQCFSIEIPGKVRAALVLAAIAIPNLVLLALAVLHVTGVKPIW